MSDTPTTNKIFVNSIPYVQDADGNYYIPVGSPDGEAVASFGGVYNAPPPTLTDGQRGDTQLDVNGNTKVTLATQLAGEDLENGRFLTRDSNPYTYISSATTTIVISGPGVLKRIIVGETAAGAITIYDNTAASGTVISVLKASIAEGTYDFDIDFSLGCTVVTAAASKITVVANSITVV